jgi:TonB family protein
MRLRERRLLERREERWAKSYNALDEAVLRLAEEDRRTGRRAMRLGVALGIVVHVALFLVVFPEIESEPRQVGSSPRLYKVQQIRFSPPRPQTQRAPSKPTTKKIPIPDPTPDDPEPFFDETVDGPDMEFPEADFGSMVSVPEGPPGIGEGPLQVVGDVKAPERVYAPDPHYPEEARQARVQGVVILQTIIDTLGKVTDVRVLKGLPSGLTEAAVQAVSSWQFRPATLDGKPVAVYYIVTVTFSVQ